MSGTPSQRRIAAAASVGALEAHAAVLRSEVGELQAVLATLRDAMPAAGDSALVEANEQLVIAALRASAVAEAAERHRDEAMRAGTRDSLTGLPNRVAMLERLRLALAAAQRRHARVAVLFLDIDRFKLINDSYGHPVGDGVLQCVAHRLASAVRETDTVGRFGGEEFLVLLEDVGSPDDVPGIVEHLLRALAEPATIGGHAIALSASVGIAIHPDDAADGASLIACSDAAMYCAKRRGPGGYAFCREIERTVDGALVLHAGPMADPSTMRHAGARAQHDVLQEANGMLVASVLDAQAREATAVDAQSRQLATMAMAAHELRNPLTPIRLAAGMLETARDDAARVVRLRDIIEAQVVYISRLVDDLVDSSRVSSGKLRVECGAADLATVLDAAVATCRPAMDALRQQLVLELSTAADLPLHADAARLVQVFTNLLDNASKYTPEGGRIELTVAPAADSVAVSVRDTGIGIPAESLPHVFDLFVQDSGAAALRPGGLGIGLAIVRELVEAHGGTVVGRSAGKDQGSTFVVTLPLAAAD